MTTTAPAATISSPRLPEVPEWVEVEEVEEVLVVVERLDVWALPDSELCCAPDVLGGAVTVEVLVLDDEFAAFVTRVRVKVSRG